MCGESQARDIPVVQEHWHTCEYCGKDWVCTLYDDCPDPHTREDTCMSCVNKEYGDFFGERYGGDEPEEGYYELRGRL